MTLTDIRLSHTSLSTYRHCPQQFAYKFVEGLLPKEDRWEVTKDFGSAIHFGIENVLQGLANGEFYLNGEYLEVDMKAMKEVAEVSVRSWVSANTEEDRTIYSFDAGMEVHHQEYYDGMDYIYNEAPRHLSFLIEHMGLGTRYRPAMFSEFFSASHAMDLECEWCMGTGRDDAGQGDSKSSCKECDGEGVCYSNDEPIIEYQFSIEDSSGATITGMIDSIMYDREIGAYTLIDWKCRGNMLDDQKVSMDSQMMLYATVFNQLSDKGAQITQATMYQVRNNPPTSAKMTMHPSERKTKTKKGWLPSTSAQRTTWEIFWDTIPAESRDNLDKAEWFNIMEGKLWHVDDWFQPITIPITPHSMMEVDENTTLTLEDIQRDVKRGTYRRLWSSHGCSLCSFKDLCKMEHRYGGNPSSVQAMKDQKYRTGSEAELEEPEI